MKKQFLIDPNITFLNHGSFGACPKPVFDVYQAWQRELEHQPVEFIGRRAVSLLAEARRARVRRVRPRGRAVPSRGLADAKLGGFAPRGPWSRV